MLNLLRVSKIAARTLVWLSWERIRTSNCQPDEIPCVDKNQESAYNAYVT